MKSTSISGFSSEPALREIAPETPGAAYEFLGFNAGYVGGFVGQACAAVVYRIDHEILEYGRDWKWLYREQWYTPDGILRIIDELNLRGFVAEASALRLHMNTKIADLRRVAPDRTWATVNEAALARRWDRRSEVMA